MFLEFFIWGAWFVTMGSYLTGTLGFSGADSALAYSTQSWGAIIAPFIIGLIADKYVNAERLLGVIHSLGAVLLYLLANATEFAGFYPYLLVYMILYMPTLALVNAIAFRQMDDPARHFGDIRVWGTVGWIVAGLADQLRVRVGLASGLSARPAAQHFHDGAAASLVLGVFSFTLPRTPPQQSRRQRRAARSPRTRRAGAAARSQFPDVFLGVDPDLHSARVLLPARQSVPDGDPASRTRPASRRFGQVSEVGSCCSCRSS